MPKAIFIKDFNYRTPKKAIIAYKAGYKGNITQLALEAARSAGVLDEVQQELPLNADTKQISKEAV